MNSHPYEVSFAMSSLLNIFISLVSIGISWWVLQQFRFDLFLKNPGSSKSKLLHILLSIALGYQVARFLIDYMDWSTLIKGMF